VKIKFLGVGSAFTTQEYYQSNMLITSRAGKNLLIDCGGDARFSLREIGIHSGNLTEKIDAVYISHLHADHIGGMEWLALSAYFSPGAKKPSLFMEKQHMRDMWNHSLKGGLERIQEKPAHLSDYFLCRQLEGHDSFLWEEIEFQLFRMPHVKTDHNDHDSFGLLIRKDGNTCFISADAQLRADFLSKIAGKTDLIFHDCETSPFKTSVHAHYDELCGLPADIKNKIWLYHYQPNPDYTPRDDGFRGFVIKGQEFDIS